MTVSVPIWLPEHIKSYDPECVDIAQSWHSCIECQDWMNQFQLADDTMNLVSECEDSSPYNFNSMCGVWATVDQFKQICSREEFPDYVIRYSLGFASRVLFALTGRQFNGMCEKVIFPGCLDNDFPIAWQYLDTEYQRDRDYSKYVASCANPGCDYDTIRLNGLVNTISEIVIDGKVLPKSEYAIRGRNELILTNGERWPKYNDLSRSPYKMWPPIPTSSNSSQEKKLTWVDEWKIDSNYSEDVPDDDWVLDFLARNPHIPIPIEESWVETWLKENGLTYSKIPGDGCEVEDCWIISPQKASQLNAYPANQCCQAACAGGKCKNEPIPPNYCCGKGCGKPKCEKTVLVFDPSSCTCSTSNWVQDWANQNPGTIASTKPSSDSSWVQQYLDENNIEAVADPDVKYTGCCRDRCGRNKDPETGEYYVCICETPTIEIAPTPCNVCKVPSNACIAEITGNPNECCACTTCVTEKPSCTCTAMEPEEIPDFDFDSAPWWVQHYFDPSVTKPVPVEPLNTEKFTGWVKDYFSDKPVAREVKSWVLDYLEDNPCVKVDPVYSKIDEKYEPHCKLYKWNTEDPEYVKAANLGLDVDYDPCRPAWLIKYYEGKCPPGDMAILATVLLARKIASGFCDSSCTPTGLSRISRGGSSGGVEMKLLDITKMSLSGMTGIYEVDMFINSVNPGRLARRGKASVSKGSYRSRTLDTIRR